MVHMGKGFNNNALCTKLSNIGRYLRRIQFAKAKFNK